MAAAKLFWAEASRGVVELGFKPFENLWPPTSTCTYGVKRDLRQLNRGPKRYSNVVSPSWTPPALPMWLAPRSATRPRTLLKLYSTYPYPPFAFAPQNLP